MFSHTGQSCNLFYDFAAIPDVILCGLNDWLSKSGVGTLLGSWAKMRFKIWSGGRNH